MNEVTLFELPPANEKRPIQSTQPEQARVLRPVRQQLQWVSLDMEKTVAQDHPARAIWDILENLDLSAFYASIKAVLERPGRPTTDPRVLLALWLLAVVDEVGSARKLARLCEEHDAYRWLCGGVPINYHMLSDFRVAHHKALDDLLTQIVGSLMAADAVTLEQVAQDGMRVRASAGASSFRRKQTLENCLRDARSRVEKLANEREHPDPGVSQREQKARERVARERVQRVEKALEYLPRAQAAKDRQKKEHAIVDRAKVGDPRTSTTDPEARVMKMPDGGFRPAYNVELATDGAKGVIIGVSVTAKGTDAGQALPMEDQIEKRTGKQPQSYLMDGGFATREDITSLEKRDIPVYAPVRLPKNRPEDERYQARYDDSPEVVKWRQRMATKEAKAVYKNRGAIAEWTNAQIRQHGLSRFTVRGIIKVTTVMFLIVITHNILQWAALRG
jgi:transposase